jgi:ribosome-associated heat shock protein Hsp15
MVDEAFSLSAQRLDVWLYRVRQFKNRADCVKLIERGGLRIVRHKRTERVTKAHFAVRIGDIVIFQKAANLRMLKVTGFPERRGPATEATGHYEEWRDVE